MSDQIQLSVQDIVETNPEDNAPWADGIGRAYDAIISASLGFKRAHSFRELVARHSKDLEKINDLIFVRTVRMDAKGRKRTAKEYYLTEKQALYLTTKSETPRASEITIAIVRV